MSDNTASLHLLDIADGLPAITREPVPEPKEPDTKDEYDAALAEVVRVDRELRELLEEEHALSSRLFDARQSRKDAARAYKGAWESHYGTAYPDPRSA